MGVMHRDVKPHNVMIDHQLRKVRSALFSHYGSGAQSIARHKIVSTNIYGNHIPPLLIYGIILVGPSTGIVSDLLSILLKVKGKKRKLYRAN